jgi:glycosyltransferase involved in cell wall biosynthesis
MQIVAYAWEQHPSSDCRAFQPLMELANRGNMIAINTTLEDLTPSDAEIAEIAREFDVAYIARYVEPEAVELARRLSAAGVPVAWDFDDDVLASRRGRTDAESVERVTGIRGMLEIVDLVTTTSERLAERFIEEGARESVAIPNYLARPHLDGLERPHEGTVLGYIGWIDHQQDWEKLGLDETVRELLEDHEDLRVEIVGPLDFGLPEERCTRTEVVPYPELPRFIAGFDLALAPLVDTAPNRMRSDIKVKEYAIAGVPWLASPVGPYERYGENEGGRLVADDDWYVEIDRLIFDRKARRKLGKRGQKWALKHTLMRNVSVWEDALTTTIQIAGERSAA